MKFSSYKIFIVLALLFQVVLFIWLNTSLDTLGDSYRYEERRTALMNWGNAHTPESKAEFDREVKLLDEHLQKRAYIMAAVFLIIDGIGIFCFWNYGVKSSKSVVGV